VRRFSKRSHLVTLSDINVTPLLDLAWVLLIIFVITTPLLERSVDLKLPEGGAPTRVDRRDIQTVEIDAAGRYFLNGAPIQLDALEKTLVAAHRSNPNLIVRIRADQNGQLRWFYPVIDRCTRNGITRISLATRPPSRR